MKDQPGRRKKTIMSNIVEVNGLKIGEGMPKICVPVVAENIICLTYILIIYSIYAAV